MWVLGNQVQGLSSATFQGTLTEAELEAELLGLQTVFIWNNYIAAGGLTQCTTVLAYGV